MSFNIWDAVVYPHNGWKGKYELSEYPYVHITESQYQEALAGAKTYPGITRQDVEDDSVAYHEAVYEVILDTHVRVPNPFEDLEELL